MMTGEKNGTSLRGDKKINGQFEATETFLTNNVPYQKAKQSKHQCSYSSAVVILEYSFQSIQAREQEVDKPVWRAEKQSEKTDFKSF